MSNAFTKILTGLALIASVVFVVAVGHFGKLDTAIAIGSFVVTIACVISLLALNEDELLRPRSNQAPPSIACSDSGFVVTAFDSKNPEKTVSMPWKDVVSVLAYKRDVFAYDLICLAFSSGEIQVEVHEQMDGWSDLIERLPVVLPGTLAVADWWKRVALPPFATSITTLFKRIGCWREIASRMRKRLFPPYFTLMDGLAQNSVN